MRNKRALFLLSFSRFSTKKDCFKIRKSLISPKFKIIKNDTDFKNWRNESNERWDSNLPKTLKNNYSTIKKCIRKIDGWNLLRKKTKEENNNSEINNNQKSYKSKNEISTLKLYKKYSSQRKRLAKQPTTLFRTIKDNSTKNLKRLTNCPKLQTKLNLRREELMIKKYFKRKSRYQLLKIISIYEAKKLICQQLKKLKFRINKKKPWEWWKWGNCEPKQTKDLKNYRIKALKGWKEIRLDINTRII